MNPLTRLAEVDWIPRQRLPNLRRLGLDTLADLITHYPRRHEDRSRFEPFPDGDSGSPVLVHGVVVKAAHLPYGGWKRGFQVTLQEASGGWGAQLVCRWFNMPYVAKMIAVGDQLVVYGRSKKKGRQTVVDFPEFEIIEDDPEAPRIHLGRITPVHPAGEGVSVRKLREWVWRALDVSNLIELRSIIPGADNSTARIEALRAIHFPESMDALEAARQKLVGEEFFSMQALIVSRRSRLDAMPGKARPASGRLLEALRASLPFELTGAQLRAIEKIRTDLAAPRRMNRLLQGDVGSGKTLVALSAALLTVEAGEQAAIMAPTQILAEQHFRTFRRLLEPLGVRVGLRTGSQRTQTGLELSGPPQVIVGTHALLHDPAELQNAGLIVIDEQHKFGVLQRSKLSARPEAPDVLVMTATPIPRTLAQTAYGDLDVTILDEKPANRGKVITGIRHASKLPEAAAFLRAQADAGRQAYIVYPLVDTSEKLELKAATAEFEKWKPLLAPHACAILHGRMRPEEKDATMRAFAAGESAFLIATTVIEVGVDVPNATVMLIENAERFGLAQLHQLRGRIGRGSHKSYCILVPGTEDVEAIERLQVLEHTNDGFEVAEADLRLRGPGDLLGTAQTGLPQLRLGVLPRDANILQDARDAARAIFAADPALNSPEHSRLREWLDAQEARLAAVAG
ncbi:MAG: ATP-dependent DNA helicase RecG [Terrimicrobiaceae bacterium]|nr:ATP-dependent DNA helicase RecG [Terrimicrobiaceae bacterium]